jgi:hypothetical protein
MFGRLSELAIPLFMFALGCVFTLIVQDLNERRVIKAESVKEVVRLSRDWYNQVHRLSLVKPRGGGPEQFYETAVADYVNNRVILPELLLHMQILKSYRDCEALVTQAEVFLSTVTDYNPHDVDRKSFGGGALECKDLLRLVEDTEANLQVLQQLDTAVQRIAAEAAKVLHG